MVRLSFTPLALAAIAAAGSVSAKTSLYLSPAHNLAAPIGINAEEAHRILSHHIKIVAADSDGSPIWAHVLNQAKADDVQVDQRAMVERLFDGHQDEENRLLVLMHGTAHNDLIPNGIQATHTINSAPSSKSFDALFDSYLSSLSYTLKSSESALSHLTGAFVDGFSASVEWLTSKSEVTAARWSKEAASFKSPAFVKLEEELRSVEALLAKLESDKQEDLSMQPLRFSGLQNVESRYGADSEEFAKAKEMVRCAVEQATKVFQARSQEHGRPASVAFVITDDAEASHLIKRSSSDLLRPFFKRASTVIRPNNTTTNSNNNLASSKPKPLPKNLARTCFTSASDLEKATNSCSGHGKAVKTSRGGKPCYRCQCQATEVRKGKKVYWAGAACEKKDVSTEFILLASSVVLLVLISMGSVYFLYAQGSEELPGTLASVTISLK